MLFFHKKQKRSGTNLLLLLQETTCRHEYGFVTFPVMLEFVTRLIRHHSGLKLSMCLLQMLLGQVNQFAASKNVAGS